MLADLLLVAVGLALLLVGGDLLVRGAVNSSLRLGIPALLVSLTVVAFGTSAPELLVAIRAALDGLPGIVFGNVVGSNIANVLLVLGLPALISGIRMSECHSVRGFLTMLGASVVFIALAWTGPFGIAHGTVLLILLGLMLYDTWKLANHHRNGGGRKRDECADDALTEGAAELLIEEADPKMGWGRILLYTALGVIALPMGADLLVDGAADMARVLGVSEAVIGLTLVALGTSLPELATSIVAAIRGQTEVAIGNVIGSNMFNLLGIMGVASLFGPLPVPEEMLRADLWVMLASALLLAPFVVLRWNIGRLWGAGLTGLYALYVVALLA